MSTDLVRLWMESFDLPIDDPSRLPIGMKLIEEEFKELRHEWNFGDSRANEIKEVGDLIWVLKQYLWFMGVNPNEVERRIFNSNMSKMGFDGRPILREDGKILKGPRYIKPDLGDL